MIDWKRYLKLDDKSRWDLLQEDNRLSYDHVDNWLMSLKSFIEQKTALATESRIYHKIWRLDWIKILDRAIKMRPSSWKESPVYEYRNASDEILCALMHFAKDKNLFPEFYKSERESIKRLKAELK